jgi:hypothetical protein
MTGIISARPVRRSAKRSMSVITRGQKGGGRRSGTAHGSNYGWEPDGHTAMATENIKIQTYHPVQLAALSSGPISHGLWSPRPSEHGLFARILFTRFCSPENANCIRFLASKLTPHPFLTVTIMTDDYPFGFLAAFRCLAAMLFTVAAPRPASPPHASVCFVLFPAACDKLAVATLQ